MDNLQNGVVAQYRDLQKRYNPFMESTQVSMDDYQSMLSWIEYERDKVNKDIGKIIEWNKLLEQEEKSHLQKQETLVNDELEHLKKARVEIEKAQAQLATDLINDKQHLEKLRAHIDAEKDALQREEEHLRELRKEFKGLKGLASTVIAGNRLLRSIDRSESRDLRTLSTDDTASTSGIERNPGSIIRPSPNSRLSFGSSTSPLTPVRPTSDLFN
jgi:septal ring factor EnvC (AmiA/AmiB activator)